MCDQRSLRSACTYAQSDQSLCWLLEDSISVKLLTEHHWKFLSLKSSCTGSYESILVKMPHCWKSHVAAHYCYHQQIGCPAHAWLNIISAFTCYFQQCGILTSVDLAEHVLPPFMLRNSKYGSISSSTFIEYSSD